MTFEASAAETSAVFDEDLMDPYTEPHTLQTDRASASWVANGHREQQRSIQPDTLLSEREREKEGKWSDRKRLMSPGGGFS